MSSGLRRYFSRQFYANVVFGYLARRLRVHLAHTPLIWGDKRRLTVGSSVHLVDAIINLRSGRVIIGDNSFLGHGVMLLTGKHDISLPGKGRHVAVQDAGRDIVIGEGVWVASGAIVIGPCTIGDNAVIGAGAVVTGDVDANSICTGMQPRKIAPIERSSHA